MFEILFGEEGCRWRLGSTLSLCVSLFLMTEMSKAMSLDVPENSIPLSKVTRIDTSPEKDHSEIFYWELQEIWRKDPSSVRISDLIDHIRFDAWWS